MDELGFILTRVAWSSTYTYILLLFVAASFIALLARPRHHKEVVKRLFAGTLLNPSEIENNDSGPRVVVRCIGNSKVVFERLDVDNLTSSGAVSLAVSFKGDDIEVIERITPGYPNDATMGGATFTIDLSGSEWRHVKWMNEENGLWCAFSLHVREGIKLTVPLKR